MGKSERQRDRKITREIHRLFWKGNWADPSGLVICYITRVPAMVISNILIPLVVAYGIQAIVTSNFERVGTYAWLVLALALVWVVLWTIGGITICRNAITGCDYVQRKVVTNYLSKDYEFYGSTYLGALGAQAVRLREGFNEYNAMMVLQGPRQVVVVVAGVTVIALQSVTLAAVTLTCMAAVLSYTVLSSRWRLRFRRKLSEASSDLAGAIGDALGQGATVKSFAAEDYEERRLQQAFVPWGKAQYRSWLASIPADDGRQLLSAITIAVLLVLTSRMYQDHSISIAVVALVQLYVVRLIGSTQEIADLIKSYETTMGSAYQAVKTMLVEPTVTDKPDVAQLPDKTKLDIEFRDITFRYEGTREQNAAVAGFNLKIAPGEKVGIVGYSGSGKTTLTKLLLRFMDVDTGGIEVGGVDIRDLAQRDLRNCIAYVPQEPMLFHRSILENIGYGKPDSNREAILAAARTAYVDEFAEDLPDGFDTLVGERGVKLSGGQRQRVAIARALLKDAPILVLDEATSALDSRSEQLIQKALWKLMQDRTALVIAHRLSTIQRMDRIAVMHKGKIVQIGTHQELLRDKQGIYAELWGHQSGGYVGVPTEEEMDGVTA